MSLDGAEKKSNLFRSRQLPVHLYWRFIGSFHDFPFCHCSQPIISMRSMPIICCRGQFPRVLIARFDVAPFRNLFVAEIGKDYM